MLSCVVQIKIVHVSESYNSQPYDDAPVNEVMKAHLLESNKDEKLKQKK